MSQSKQFPSDFALDLSNRWLSIPEAARYIRATNFFVEVLCRRKRIPYKLNGKRYVIDRHDLDAYMLAGKVAPVTSAASESEAA